MSDCNCVLKNDWPGSDPCNEESPQGNICSKPTGHDGPHAACNVVEHPTEVWEKD